MAHLNGKEIAPRGRHWSIIPRKSRGGSLGGRSVVLENKRSFLCTPWKDFLARPGENADGANPEGPGDPTNQTSRLETGHGRKRGWETVQAHPHHPLPSSKEAAHRATYHLPPIKLDSPRLNSRGVLLPLHLASGPRVGWAYVWRRLSLLTEEEGT